MANWLVKWAKENKKYYFPICRHKLQFKDANQICPARRKLPLTRPLLLLHRQHFYYFYFFLPSRRSWCRAEARGRGPVRL